VTDASYYQVVAAARKDRHFQIPEADRNLFPARVLVPVPAGRLVKVLRAEVDAAGYDLILEPEGVTRHVLLKASRKRPSHLAADNPRETPGRQRGCRPGLYSVQSESGRAQFTRLEIADLVESA